MAWLTFKILIYPSEILAAMPVIKDRMYHYGYYNNTEQVLSIDHKQTQGFGDDGIMHGGFSATSLFFCCLAIHHKANRVVTQRHIVKTNVWLS